LNRERDISPWKKVSPLMIIIINFIWFSDSFL
jgi:hypothetical protein